MKKNQIITGLLALTIVLSGCSKGRSYDNGTNMPEQNVSSNYQPYVPRYNTEESTEEETTYDDSSWDEEANDDYMYDEYEAICTMMDNTLDVLNNMGYWLNTDDSSFQEQADKVTSDLNHLKEGWEQGDFDKIDDAESDLLRHTQKLQEMIRDYKLNQHTGPYTLDDDYQLLGGEENDFLFADIDTADEAKSWSSVLPYRIGDQYDWHCVTWDDGMENDDDKVFFINLSIASQALDSEESLPVLRDYFKSGFDDGVDEGRLIDSLDSDMRDAYNIVGGQGLNYSASNNQPNTLATTPVLVKKM